jgi:hypothetical protein
MFNLDKDDILLINIWFNCIFIQLFYIFRLLCIYESLLLLYAYIDFQLFNHFLFTLYAKNINTSEFKIQEFLLIRTYQ